MREIKKQLEIEDMPNNLQYAIAEFIYSRDNDILIKSDARTVIEEFKSFGVDVSSTIETSIHSVTNLIRLNCEFHTRQLIMDKYFKGKLNYKQ